MESSPQRRLGRGARDAFSTLLESHESAELLEGLGWAGYGRDDAQLMFEAREAAHR